MNVPRETQDDAMSAERSLERVAACIVAALFLAGFVCGLVLRPFVLGVL